MQAIAEMLSQLYKITENAKNKIDRSLSIKQRQFPILTIQ